MLVFVTGLAQLERGLLAAMLLRDYEVSLKDGCEYPKWTPAHPFQRIIGEFPVQLRRIPQTAVQISG